MSSRKLERLAAVDLGSNSFHLQVGRVVERQIYLLDSIREPVRLGAGLNQERRLDRAAQLRALEALGRMGERLRGFSGDSVRAVGTNALRVARNAESFLQEAERALGFPIEVIFGKEEARLIYLGVAHAAPATQGRRLVVDIGGGSTECIIGTGLDPELTESLSMGCVSYTQRYFSDGSLSRQAFKKAELSAASELQRIAPEFRRAGWRSAVASSGSARAIAAILGENGWAESGINAEGLERLRNCLIKAGDLSRLSLRGLRDDRAAIIAGGVAIMSAVFSELRLDQIDVTDVALRQGVLYDLLGRVQHQDMRASTVREFMRRYHVDTSQAERVAALSQTLFGELNPKASEPDVLALRFAALLHEIGISIAHAGYHKHSSYILSQADMPGFSQAEQSRLARLVLAHRGKLSKIESLPARSVDWMQIVSIRLAALLCKTRTAETLPVPHLRQTEDGFTLALDRNWLEGHPLTEAVLEAEIDEWRGLGMDLLLVDRLPGTR